MAADPLSLTALEQAELVRAGQVSARELVEASLGAIERIDGELNAFITLAAERARAEADRVGPGDDRPLAGVPIAVKDILALTEGIRTTFGTAATGDWVPPIDSNVVARLRGAGAIIVGKTNTPELGILPVTEPDRFGPTRNPWDTSRTPGGSSGGSAAAVAAGLVSLAHGNDGGGSIRIPAACCGLVGLKATRGRISHAPVPDDPAGLPTEGVLTRDVAGTAAALDLLSGNEPGDTYLAPAPETTFTAAAAREPATLRIGFTTTPPTGAQIDPTCAALVTETAELLESLGHEVEESAPEMGGEAFIEAFLTVWIAVVGGNARGLSLVLGRPVEPEQLEHLTRETMRAAEEISAADLLGALGMLRIMGRQIGLFWRDHDILLTPALAQLPLPLGALRADEGDAREILMRSSDFTPFTPVWNATGQPALSLPLGQSAAGLPLGVQFVGAPAGEATLLSLAGQLEQARPWAARRPPVSAV